MNASTLVQKSHLLSWVLFPFVVWGVLAFERHFHGNKGEASFLASTGVLALLGLALAWQAFTIRHHKRRVLPYVLAIIYATVFFGCVFMAAA